MAKFLMVTTLPDKLEKGEMVVENPTFVDEIFECKVKSGARKVTSVNHLRALLDLITFKYDKTTNPMHVNLSNYEGRAYADDKELGKILFDIIEKECPQVIDRYVEHKLQSRPQGTTMVYSTVSTKRAHLFIKNGLDEMGKEEAQATKKTIKKQQEKQSDETGV